MEDDLGARDEEAPGSGIVWGILLLLSSSVLSSHLPSIPLLLPLLLLLYRSI